MGFSSKLEDELNRFHCEVQHFRESVDSKTGQRLEGMFNRIHDHLSRLDELTSSMSEDDKFSASKIVDLEGDLEARKARIISLEEQLAQCKSELLQEQRRLRITLQEKSELKEELSVFHSKSPKKRKPKRNVKKKTHLSLQRIRLWRKP
ncbi:hypothetical protein ACJJI3_09505 [Microbulbifer sp. ZKSA004]|uniref:hypothetical protein n=1 Tax=Microbulbifer sp. ZKSA004 TaxID=3243389 RepID=UPI00403917D3